MSTASQHNARPVSRGTTSFADSAVPITIAGIAILLAGVPLLGLLFGGDIYRAQIPSLTVAIFLFCTLVLRLQHRLVETNRRLAALETNDESTSGSS